jgi:hypothetical protein
LCFFTVASRKNSCFCEKEAKIFNVQTEKAGRKLLSFLPDFSGFPAIAAV